jgi:hypothetical protein
MEKHLAIFHHPPAPPPPDHPFASIKSDESNNSNLIRTLRLKKTTYPAHRRDFHRTVGEV